MKYLSIILAACILAVACNKTNDADPATNNNSNNNQDPGCGDGFICFMLDDREIAKAGGGYELADTNLFVKWEEGAEQLSIDIFGKSTGAYSVSNKRLKGNGRLYYFPDNTSQYMAESGNLEVTAYDAASKKISGTFSGTLYKYDDATETFDQSNSIEIKDGKFVNISVPKI